MITLPVRQQSDEILFSCRITNFGIIYLIKFYYIFDIFLLYQLRKCNSRKNAFCHFIYQSSDRAQAMLCRVVDVVCVDVDAMPLLHHRLGLLMFLLLNQ